MTTLQYAVVDLLKARDRGDGYWSIRPSKLGVSCHYYFLRRKAQDRAIGSVEHVMGAWFDKDKLILRLHGPSITFPADFLQKRTPEQVADMITRAAERRQEPNP